MRFAMADLLSPEIRMLYSPGDAVPNEIDLQYQGRFPQSLRVDDVNSEPVLNEINESEWQYEKHHEERS
jgi:hypothetical protein